MRCISATVEAIEKIIFSARNGWGKLSSIYKEDYHYARCACGCRITYHAFRVQFKDMTIRLLFLSIVLLQTSAFSQTPSPFSETDLIAAIMKMDQSHQSEVEVLLNEHSHLVTTSLWNKLVDRAAFAYYGAGPERALWLYDVAIKVAECINDQKLLATTWYKIGRNYSGMGKMNESIQAYLTSRKIFEEAGLGRDLIYILSDLGTLYFYVDDYRQARIYSEQSLRLADSLKNSHAPLGAWPDDFGVAGALSTLASLRHRQGDLEGAIDLLKQSLALYRELDQDSLKYGFQLSDTIAELGRVHTAIGDNMQALVYLTEALDIAKRQPSRDLVGRTLNSLGILYLEQEDYEKATELLKQSLQVYQSLKNRGEQSRVLLNLAVVDQRTGNDDRALERFRASLDQATEANMKDVMISAGEGIGAVLRVKGDYVAAIEMLDRSLQLAEEIGSQTQIAEILWRKAEVCVSTENYVEAVTLAERSLALARQLRFSNLIHLSAKTLGEAYLGLKKDDDAFQVLNQAIEQAEAMRYAVAGREQGRQLYFENKVAAYHLLSDLFIARNRSFDALRIAERAKSRVLLDAISDGGNRVRRSEREREEEERLNQVIITLNNAIRIERLKPAPDTTRLADLSSQLNSARLRYESFMNLISAAHPNPRTHALETLALTQNSLTELVGDRKTAVIEYVVMRDRLRLFVLTRSGREPTVELKTYVVSIAQADLDKRVRRFHHLIAENNAGFVSLSRELYDLLLKPAESQLRGKETLCIIPDAALWDVPFQALQAKTSRYLIEDYAVYYAPSLSVLRGIAKRKSIDSNSSTLLAFANPVVGTKMVARLQNIKRGESFEPLPEAETEVRSLIQIFGAGRSKVFVGAHAQEESFKSFAPSHRIIHFATHGVIDNRKPLYSYLLLSKTEVDQNDGLLEAREIMNYRLNADLAVLSACETARGRIGTGEGVVGMSWAFIAAGCRATVVSQWKVGSASTSELMVSFYRKLANRQTQNSKASALRLAALEMMKDPRYRHPFHWAAFVIIGNNE